ncbi:MAG: ABC transporter ATP-binding protein [Bacilli bacterium]|nr:ABC transporter ATP-binding protein [Bacilli bacterium]
MLDNISFEIKPRQFVGVIGSSGSGKTTLISMINRLYDVDEGSVYIDNTNVKDLSLFKLRESIAVVLQKNTLFSGTIAENLRWGNEYASDEDLISACKIAQADGFIQSFKDKYETELEQGGLNLSGGQRQRLCIARAILKKPKVLILDDSTSAVDTATDRTIRKALKEDLNDTTKIIIAQRIHSIIDADKIIVLENGKIAGVGTHIELMEKCKEYQEIYYSQINKEDTIDGK